jgi:hypothetical protein
MRVLLKREKNIFFGKNSRVFGFFRGQNGQKNNFSNFDT